MRLVLWAYISSATPIPYYSTSYRDQVRMTSLAEPVNPPTRLIHPRQVFHPKPCCHSHFLGCKGTSGVREWRVDKRRAVTIRGAVTLGTLMAAEVWLAQSWGSLIRYLASWVLWSEAR